MATETEKNIINSNIKNFVYEMEWLDPHENIIGNVEVDVFGGSANFDDSNNNKRSVSLSLANLDKQYLPSPNSKMWINNRVRLKCGYKHGNNEKLMYNQGVYVLGNPSILSAPSQKEVSLQLLDKYVLIDGTISGKLKNKHIIAIGTRIDTAIKSIITDLIGETKYIVDQCFITTPYTITKEINSSIADLLNELCFIAGDYQVAYNNDGYLHFSKVLTVEDINTLPIVYNYTTSGDYIQSTKELKWNEVRNKVVIYGMYDKDTGIQYKATAEDATGSEMSIDKIEERAETLEIQELNSNALCKARAD